MIHEFTLNYWIDDGWYVGKLREVPSVFSQGETLLEPEENIADAYRMILNEFVFLLEQADDILPQPDILSAQTLDDLRCVDWVPPLSCLDQHADRPSQSQSIQACDATSDFLVDAYGEC